MGIWRPLKGVLTHCTADWYIDQLAVTYGQGSLLTHNGGVILWNNSNPPASFYLYRLTLTQNQTPYPLNLQAANQPLGSVYGPAYPVGLGGPTPPGLVYAFDGNLTNTGSGIFAVVQPAQYGVVDLDSDFPLVVIPKNAGLAVWSNQPTNVDFFATFWFVWK